MAEKPILFNTEMVKAILDGRKTQTRRVCKGQPQDGVTNPETMGYKPPYRSGDILWVRETWAKDVGRYMYKANYSDTEKFYMNGREIKMVWRPSIHMPRVAARLFLRIIGVRTERLQDMTEEDAICEGYDGMPWCYHHVFENYPDSPIPCDASSGYDCPPDRPCDKSIPELFGETIWNPTIKKSDLDRYGWEANPWVWVIEFERLKDERAGEWADRDTAQYADAGALMPAT